MTTHDEDKIIAAAKEAGFAEWENTDSPEFLALIAEFYAIAFEAGRQAEREECATLCDMHADGWEKNPGSNPMAGYVASSNCAFTIRARGDMK